MPVEVQIGSSLRRRINAERSILAQGGNVREVFEDIASKYPEFKEQVLDEKGQLYPYVMVLLNDEDVRLLDGLDTKLEEGSSLAVLLAMSGG